MMCSATCAVYYNPIHYESYLGVVFVTSAPQKSGIYIKKIRLFQNKNKKIPNSTFCFLVFKNKNKNKYYVFIVTFGLFTKIFSALEQCLL